MKNFGILATFLLFTACNDYWWSRGQAPDTSTLLERASNKLNAARDSYADSRPKMSDSSSEIESTLVNINSELNSGKAANTLSSELGSLIEQFKALEPNLSYTSRPAYGELSGQLRAFANSANENNFSKEGFTLFSARTLSFLASELSLPS